MDIDPAKATTIYVADRGVETHDAIKHFTPERAWDCFGALASSADAGYRAVVDGRLGAPTALGQTTFAGDRNGGHHHVRLHGPNLDLRIKAELTELYQPDGYTPDRPPSAQFQQHLNNGDGTFDINPSWVAPPRNGGDAAALDLTDRRMTLRASRMTVDEDGVPGVIAQDVHLDPERDRFVTVGEAIDGFVAVGPEYGSTEHQYNPNRRLYRSVRWTHRFANGRMVREASPPGPAQPVDQLIAHRESTYDSAEALHDFIVREPGRAFTMDTSPDVVVWNHAVSALQLDEERSVDRVEDGERYRFTSFRLTYETAAGPLKHGSIHPQAG